ncbi:TPA: NAD-dependent epimerase/dehydratase family protein [Photobacterium damselae]
MTKILLTGGSGFIGSHFPKSDKNIKYVLRNKEEAKRCKSSFFINKIDGESDWSTAFNGVDSIIHLAGLAHSATLSPDDYYSVNTQGTLKLAKDAVQAGVKRFVFVSSIGVNGSSTIGEKVFSYSSDVAPHNIYAKSKLDAEIGLKNIAEQTGLEVVIVRPTLVYGQNAPGNFGLLTKIVKKLPILPFGSINNKRSFIAVQNLVDLLLTCAEHPDAADHIFLASDGKPISIKQFTNAIAKGLNKSIYQLPIPICIMRLSAKLIGKKSIAEQLFNNLEVDSSNAFDIMQWKAPYSMEQAMSLLSEEIR